jgi:hypothetical protein
LRSLSVDGLCPECATPVALSLRGDLLRNSDPEWLRLLRIGIYGIISSDVLAIVALLMSRAFLGVHYSRSMYWLVRSIVCGISFLGIWLITIPDPSGMGEDRYGLSRKIIRITLITEVAQLFLIFFRDTTAATPLIRQFLDYASALASVANLVGDFAFYNYVRKLAVRIPADDISARAGSLIYSLGIPSAIVTLFGVAIRLTTLSSRTILNKWSAFVCVLGLAFVALVVFGILYLVMLGKLAGKLRESEISARRLWQIPAP